VPKLPTEMLILITRCQKTSAEITWCWNYSDSEPKLFEFL